ncbi:MAG TPA: TetR/AcrR family transcriptional regulator [Streptosporangiaceae bacterium]|nr:TetR/AcrR family transcriptional regulator [Streptosporangiaceae bacterium]
MAVRPKESAGTARGSAVRPVKERLLRVATRLFARNGFEGTSVQDIVDAAGVTKGAMYHYYGSKDDLLYEVYHQLLTLQTTRLTDIVKGSGSAEDRLRAAAIDVVESSLANLDDLIVFFRSLHMLPADRQTQVRAERRAYHDQFRGLVEEGMAAGSFRTAVPADVAVHYFLSSVNQLGVWFRPDGPLTARQVGEQYAELLVGGLRA